MATKKEALRDWHRLFGLLLTDFFTGSPFTVEVERDLSQQQQLLDVVHALPAPRRRPHYVETPTPPRGRTIATSQRPEEAPPLAAAPRPRRALAAAARRRGRAR